MIIGMKEHKGVCPQYGYGGIPFHEGHDFNECKTYMLWGDSTDPQFIIGYRAIGYNPTEITMTDWHCQRHGRMPIMQGNEARILQTIIESDE